MKLRLEKEIMKVVMYYNHCSWKD